MYAMRIKGKKIVAGRIVISGKCIAGLGVGSG